MLVMAVKSKAPPDMEDSPCKIEKKKSFNINLEQSFCQYDSSLKACALSLGDLDCIAEFVQQNKANRKLQFL